MKKIGLLGGTFDPIHNGHLIISEYLRDELKLHEVWFIPAKKHPLKDPENITPADYRFKMIEIAIETNNYFKVNDIELRRKGTSYTVDTLNQLHEEAGDRNVQFYFFIGMDNVNDLHRWKKPMEIISMCQVVAFGRPGFVPDDRAKKYLPQIQFVHVPLLEISSTFIRNRLAEGKSVRYLIPEKVNKFIQLKKLYR